MKNLFTLGLVAALTFSRALAYYEVGGIYYNLDETTKTASVTKRMSGPDNVVAYVGDVVIPSEIIGYNGTIYSVTSIDKEAFVCTYNLISVTIPNSVTSIGMCAFYDSGINSVVIPNSVTSIGNNAFTYCANLTSITIGNAVTSIGVAAFGRCESLVSITLPKSVSNIGYAAFNGCSSLVSIKVAYNNPYFSSIDGVLCNKEGTTLIAYPDGKTKEYTTPNSITTIGEGAFYLCTNLTSITISNSVTTIEPDAFLFCTGLSSVYVLATTPPKFLGGGMSAATLYVPYGCKEAYAEADGWKSFGTIVEMEKVGWHDLAIDGVYYHLVDSTKRATVSICDTFTYKGNVVIPSEVTYRDITYAVTGIEEGTFSQCRDSFSLVLPNTWKGIGIEMFEYCRGLVSITLPDSLKTIRRDAFRSCSSLESIIIPNTVTSIGEAAFISCTSLASVQLSNSLTRLEESVFGSCESLTSIVIPQSVKVIEMNAFNSCKSLVSVTLPDSLTSLGELIFWNCTSLESIVIPETLTSIEYGTFSGCESLDSVVIPNSVKSIEMGAFWGCRSLTSVSIGNSVWNIEVQAFQNCESLSTITFPASVRNIKDFAFKNTGLTTVYSLAKKPPYCNGWYRTFTNVDLAAATLYVPAGCKEAYAEATEWKDFGTIIEMEFSDFDAVRDQWMTVVDSLRTEWRAAWDTIATECPGVAEQFEDESAAIGVRIEALADSVTVLYETRQLIDTTDFSPEVEDIRAAIAALLYEARATQAADDLLAANDSLFAVWTSEIEALRTELQAAWDTIMAECPGVAVQFEDDTAAIASRIETLADIVTTLHDLWMLSSVDDLALEVEDIRAAIAALVAEARAMQVTDLRAVRQDDDGTDILIYDMAGRAVCRDVPQRGVYILRRADGTVRKVMVK